MKTSNIILISFLTLTFISISAYLLATAYYLSQNQESNYLRKSQNTEAAKTSYHFTPIRNSFSVVSITDTKQLYFSTDSVTGLVRTKAESPNSKSNYTSENYSMEVRMDTLFISNLNPDKDVAFTLKIDKNLKSIVLDRVSNMQGVMGHFNFQDSLTVNSSNSNITFTENFGLKFLKYDGDSGSYIRAAQINNLEINLNKSIAIIDQGLQQVAGDLSNTSEIILPRSTKTIKINKDDTSLIYFQSH